MSLKNTQKIKCPDCGTEGEFTIWQSINTKLNPYKPLVATKDFTLLELWLETGRTHQIRCHMAYLGHPLLLGFSYNGARSTLQLGMLAFMSSSAKTPESRSMDESSGSFPQVFLCRLSLRSFLRPQIFHTDRTGFP